MYKLIVILLLFLLGFYFIYRSNDIEALTPSHSAGNNSDEEYSYTSDPEDETNDSDYVYNEESSIDDYNYESYKTKQKAKRQKLDEQLVKLKKTLEIIKNNQEKMHALLIKNNKVIGNSIKMSNNTDYKNNWARRLRIKY